MRVDSGRRDESATPKSFDVTVVIPAYQARHFVLAAVASALEQSTPSPAVIVVDDGSTDGTADLVASRYPEVRVVTIDHGGEAAARNAGLEAAATEWVAFLDADDRYLPGRLAAIAELIANDRTLDAVTTNAYMEVNGEVSGLCYGERHTFADRDQATEILRRNFLFGHVIVKRSRLLGLGGFDTTIRHTADWAMWTDLILDGGRVGFIDRALSVYRIHAGSASADRTRMAEGSLGTLRRAAARTDLDREQREAIDASVESFEDLLDRSRLDQAIRSGDDQIRPLAIDIAKGSQHPFRQRGKAAMAALSPQLMVWSRRFFRRNSVIGTAGWAIPATEVSADETGVPLVSIVLPFLNEIRYLQGAVDSIQQQTMASWELFLVDDGSSDGSGELADAMAAADPTRIRVLRHPERRNEGLAASGNLGLSKTRAGAIAFIHADDRWEPEKLETQLRSLAETPEAGMVTGSTRHSFFDSDRPDEIHPAGLTGPGLLPIGRFARDLVRERVPMPPPPSTVLYRAAALEAAGGIPPGNSTYEDQRTFLVLSLAAPILVTEDVLSTYARRGDSIYGRLATDNVTKSSQRREFEWWALRAALQRVADEPRSLGVVAALIAHRLRVAVTRRIDLSKLRLSLPSSS